MTRSRGSANLAVSSAEYQGALEAWLLTPPITGLRSKVGVLQNDFRAVTPSAISVALPAITALIDAGLTSGIVQSSKMEAGFRRIPALNPALMGTDTKGDSLAHSACTHVQCCLTMLRNFKVEDGGHGGGCRRYSKSGGFRRKLTSEDWTWLTPLLAKIDIESDPAPLADVEAPSPIPLRDDKTKIEYDVEVDEQGFPLIFGARGRSPQRHTMLLSNMEHTAFDLSPNLVKLVSAK